MSGLSAGRFRLLAGACELWEVTGVTRLTLRTEYSNLRWILLGPITAVLYLFQRYLLHFILRNAKHATA